MKFEHRQRRFHRVWSCFAMRLIMRQTCYGRALVPYSLTLKIPLDQFVQVHEASLRPLLELLAASTDDIGLTVTGVVVATNTAF